MDRTIKRKNTNIMNGVICWILAIIFVAIGAYVIGLHRGYKTYDREYDKGYVNGYTDAYNEINLAENE